MDCFGFQSNSVFVKCRVKSTCLKCIAELAICSFISPGIDMLKSKNIECRPFVNYPELLKVISRDTRPISARKGG